MKVVVVGAGPAGMHAAVAAARGGARVVLVDSAPQAGGQYYRRPPGGTAALPHVFEELRRQPRIEHLPDATVWAMEAVPGGLHRLHVQQGPADAPGRRSMTIEAAALVLATGAYDRVVPFPGWDLPGVYTAGAAQALAKSQRVAVGRRVLVCGTGPFLLPVARSLLAVGAEVAGVLEANAPATCLRGWLRRPAHPWHHRAKAAELAGYAALLARHRVPYRPRTAVIAAHGTDHVEAVTTARLDPDWNPVPGSERRFAVDAVCVGHGFTPQLEPVIAAGCRTRGGFAEVDDRQATSVPGVFAAGELTGIGGADLSAAEGTVAGCAAARHLGHAPDPAREAAARRRVRHWRDFAAALAAAHPVRPGWQTWAADDTLVCRCEEVTVRELRDAVEHHRARGARSLKLLCRVGLGPCQGRICGRNATELADAFLRERGAPPLLDPDAAAKRPLAAPVRLADLATPPTAYEAQEGT
ncbi:FAD-dependent oxidoreductase [Wenjunlia tyrosinilytica]|uniref:FAD-dependent oxidoreductase n=1 Tax=Wenjunlia tyrosinilytica TaxID=1544741 RepID=UPI001663414C|nr:NAD(P)/FAD-dependent oxidoreductase [Wenjunlia tyrosinilytica]